MQEARVDAGFVGQQIKDLTTKGPMWGHPVPVLGAISPFLEPFRGRLSPNIDNVSEKNDFEIPPRRALGGSWPYSSFNTMLVKVKNLQ